MAWVKSGNRTITQTCPAYMNRTEWFFHKRKMAGLTRGPTPETYVADKKKMDRYFGKPYKDVKRPAPTLLEQIEYKETTSPKMQRVAAAKKTIKSITQRVITKAAPLSTKKPFVGITPTVQAVPQTGGGRSGISGMIIGVVLIAIALVYVVLKKVL